MAIRARRPCAALGCTALVSNGRYCSVHRPTSTSRRPSSAQRGYGRRWRKLRKLHLSRYPLCVDPFDVHSGVAVLATDVDHIIRRRLGGSDSHDNLQSLCHSCHSRKTAAERMQG